MYREKRRKNIYNGRERLTSNELHSSVDDIIIIIYCNKLLYKER